MRYCNLSIFKTAAVCPHGILKLNFLTAIHARDTFCVITLNFVEIKVKSQLVQKQRNKRTEVRTDELDRSHYLTR